MSLYRTDIESTVWLSCPYLGAPLLFIHLHLQPIVTGFLLTWMLFTILQLDGEEEEEEEEEEVEEEGEEEEGAE